MKTENMNDWDYSKVQSLIDNQVEESLSLEYKAADALQRTESKKREVTKDVSAMANSAGGVIVYGIMEYNDHARSHLPERIDPISRAVFNKESLESVINGIQPRIAGIVITPIQLAPNGNYVVFVVEIPQSLTAHQSQDHRYYKRFNFQSVPMEDYEIRDVMFREKVPHIKVLISLSTLRTTANGFEIPELIVRAVNVGNVYARYVTVFLAFPRRILLESISNPPESERETNKITCSNLVGSNFHPILPGTSFVLQRIALLPLDHDLKKKEGKFSWSVSADNAPSRVGRVLLAEVPSEKEVSGEHPITA
jgi:hypothetical protein